MANPQKENGYVGIANDLFEAVYMQHDFTKRQLRVLSTIIRHTYGWNVKECTLSLRDISAETGINYRHVSTTLQELIEMCVLSVEGSLPEKKTYKFNKDYDSWRVTKTVTQVSPKWGLNSHQNGDTRVTKTVTHTYKRQNKDNKDRHSDKFLSLWNEYPAKKRDGLEFVSAEAEQEVLENLERVLTALREYLESVNDEKYLVKAEKFFNGKWKAYVDDENTEDYQRGRYE